MSVIPFTRSSEDARTAPDVEVAMPVHNEEGQLAASVTRLRAFLDECFPLEARIVIVDNASTDGTWAIARHLADSLHGVDALHLDRKGRGRALRAAWSRATAPVVAYMDVDLATHLDALLPLIAPLVSGHSDISIGTRLAPGAHVVRGARRELLSRGYNVVVRMVLGSSCTDAQCGFKALHREAVAELLPLVEDDEWFFDTELLVTAQRIGLRIHEVPVDWTDDLDSRVDVLRTAWKDLRGVGRLARPAARRLARSRPVRPDDDAWAHRTARRPVAVHDLGRHLDRLRSDDRRYPGATVDHDQVFADELLRFAGVGVVSTAVYLALVILLRATFGIYLANALAIVACSLGNTAVHRRLTRRAGAGADRRRQATVGAALLGVSLAGTTTALAAIRAVGLDALPAEMAALTVGNLAAAVVRFGILRTWVFRPSFGTNLTGAPPADDPAMETMSAS
jgi:glycosyltransferase involved in cell wall biosynthesis/putative flippase GtrA